jgi:N-ethylmaleimide reductase
VHAAGGKIFMQLWHVGRISHPSLQPNGAAPVGPSALKPAGQVWTGSGLADYVTPRALELVEIAGIIAAYQQAASNAREAGFDGVEIHGANGYLLDQFLRSSTNLRSDAYGGSLAKRARLMLEVTEAVCSVWGGERVGIRLSPENSFNDIHDEQPKTTFEYLATELNRFGLAYLHVLEGEVGVPAKADAGFDYAALRACFKGPYMANNGYDRQRAVAAIADGNADLIAFGRHFISNPDFPARLESGAAIVDPDTKTLYAGEAHGYIDYPTLAVV